MKLKREELQQKGIPHLPGDWEMRTDTQRVRWLSVNHPDVFESLFNPEDFINWSELSRYLSGGHRNCIGQKKRRDIYNARVDALIEAIREWQKTSITLTPFAK